MTAVVRGPTGGVRRGAWACPPWTFLISPTLAPQWGLGFDDCLRLYIALYTSAGAMRTDTFTRVRRTVKWMAHFAACLGSVVCAPLQCLNTSVSTLPVNDFHHVCVSQLRTRTQTKSFAYPLILMRRNCRQWVAYLKFMRTLHEICDGRVCVAGSFPLWCAQCAMCTTTWELHKLVKTWKPNDIDVWYEAGNRHRDSSVTVAATTFLRECHPNSTLECLCCRHGHSLELDEGKCRTCDTEKHFRDTKYDYPLDSVNAPLQDILEADTEENGLGLQQDLIDLLHASATFAELPVSEFKPMAKHTTPRVVRVVPKTPGPDFYTYHGLSDNAVNWWEIPSNVNIISRKIEPNPKDFVTAIISSFDWHAVAIAHVYGSDGLLHERATSTTMKCIRNGWLTFQPSTVVMKRDRMFYTMHARVNKYKRRGFTKPE